MSIWKFIKNEKQNNERIKMNANELLKQSQEFHKIFLKENIN